MQDPLKRLAPFVRTLAKLNERDQPTFPTPFDEPIYTVLEVASILRWSPHKTTQVFRNEPGVRDLSLSTTRRYRKRRYNLLRIPHSVLLRVWNKTEIQKGGAA
jgi:hypothetical protein